MFKQLPTRQRIRKALILLSLLIFPITMNYFSPYVIIDGAMQGIINGSFVMFGLMFLSALSFGRMWCGWACPAAGLGEAAFGVNSRPANLRRLAPIKWIIWVPWMILIAVFAWSAGGFSRFDFFHLTESGISVDEPGKYFIYLIVVGIFVLLSFTAGRRAGCHTICWMAPFMILGRKTRNLFGWPALRLVSETDACRNCKKCTRECPMSLDVNAMVQAGKMEHSECILCGTCLDGCPEKAIRYSFSAGHKPDIFSPYHGQAGTA